MADTKTDSNTKPDSKAGAPGGVDVNEETVATHPGFVAASDEPHPNPHIAGQIPASETNQPTAGPGDDLQRVLGDAERALSARTCTTRTASRRPGRSISTRSRKRSSRR
jgi:hypothetical protein